MKKLLKQIKWDAILISLLYIVLGIVCIVIPETMVKTIGYLIGALLIIAGAVSMICYLLREAHQNYYRNDFVYGLVSIAIGIIVLYKVDWLIELVPVILGILVLASGCSKLQDVIDMKRMEYGNWVLMLILAVINVLIGVVVIFNPFETALLLFQLVGVSLIFSGATDCFVVLFFAGKIKKYYENLYAVDSTYVEVVNQENESQEDLQEDAAEQNSEDEDKIQENSGAQEGGIKIDLEKDEGTKQ
ncbi:MAG: HdeD family acid-resistance protein [Lachnospiraceae bacterium]|nr:HdeD family acid-resistance protein [Lachnospiraceae bacterium]